MYKGRGWRVSAPVKSNSFPSFLLSCSSKFWSVLGRVWCHGVEIMESPHRRSLFHMKETTAGPYRWAPWLCRQGSAPGVFAPVVGAWKPTLASLDTSLCKLKGSHHTCAFPDFKYGRSKVISMPLDAWLLKIVVKHDEHEPSSQFSLCLYVHCVCMCVDIQVCTVPACEWVHLCIRRPEVYLCCSLETVHIFMYLLIYCEIRVLHLSKSLWLARLIS